MIKKIYLLVLMAVQIFFTTAQQNKLNLFDNVKWQSLPNSTRPLTPLVISTSDSFLVVITTYKRKYNISKFDKNSLVLIDSKIIDLKFEGKKLKFDKSSILNGVPIIISSFYDKTTRENTSYYHIIDENNLRISKPILLFKRVIDKVIVKDREWANFLGPVILASSKNKNMIILSYPSTEKSIEYTQDHFFKAKIFDKNLREIGGFQYEIPFPIYVLNEWELGENGFFYQIIDSNKTIFDDNTKTSKYLLVIDTKTGNLKKYQIKIKNEIISDVSIKVLIEGGICLTGFTIDKNSGIKGSFYILYDKNMKVLNEITHNFGEDFVISTLPEKKRKESKKKSEKYNRPRLNNFNINYVFELSDGSVTVLAEQFIFHQGSSYASSYTRSTYEYGAIIAINYNKYGEFTWERVVSNKHKISEYRHLLSYFVIKNKDDLSFVFNKISYDPTIINITLMLAGEITKSEFKVQIGEKEFRVSPMYSTKNKDNEYFIFVQRIKRSKIGILKINN